MCECEQKDRDARRQSPTVLVVTFEELCRRGYKSELKVPNPGSRHSSTLRWITQIDERQRKDYSTHQEQPTQYWTLLDQHDAW